MTIQSPQSQSIAEPEILVAYRQCATQGMLRDWAQRAASELQAQYEEIARLNQLVQELQCRAESLGFQLEKARCATG